MVSVPGVVIVGGMPQARSDKLLAQALRLARKGLEERANAEDLEELALVVLELDEAIVVDGGRGPKRWCRPL